MSMDITGTLAPDSSQINADDLIQGPITITVRDVTKGTPEQPINIHSHEYPDRSYRPSKTMRKLIAAGWGTNAAAYAGRRLTLVRNPNITFGKDKVGGIEVSAMSDLEEPLSVALMVSRGKRRMFTVAPLDEEAAPAETGEIPENVREQVARVKESGNQAEYLKWLDDGEAPEAIKQYARDQFGEK